MANENQAAQQEAAKPAVKMSIADIKSMLNNGLDRKQIAKHYGVTQATMKRVFLHPDLKGLKHKPTVPVELLDEQGQVVDFTKFNPEKRAAKDVEATAASTTSEATDAPAAPIAAPTAEVAPTVVSEDAPKATATPGMW